MNRLSKIVLLFFLFFTSGLTTKAQIYSALMSEIRSMQTNLVPDKRVAILDVSLEDTLRLPVLVRGETSLPEAKSQILQLLKNRNIPFVDSIRVFPEASLGDKTWGLVALSVANMRSEPSHAAELVSQALMGTPMKILEYEQGWYRVQTPDRYIGWMESSGLKRFTPEEMDTWKKSDRFVFNRISGNAFDSPSRKGKTVTDLVLGDLFEVVGKTKGFLKIKIPDGRTGFVRKKDGLSWTEWTERQPDVRGVIAFAQQLLGVPYLWGGTSCKAVDCSGLTKTAYYSQAIILARDASQQARYGEQPDFENIGRLQAGDLLFFGRSAQRITHVGIYMGAGKYIHASGLVRINTIDPNHPDYSEADRKDFVGVSRILNSMNTEGITRVKDHPWYSFP